MNLKPTQLSISLLLGLVAPVLAAYPETSVPAGLHVISPDGRYSVELVETEAQWRYAIKNIETGQLDNSIVMPTVLLYLHWEANSQSIVAVEHIPKGSCGRVIYSQNGKWRDIEVRPPGEKWVDSTVVSLQIKSDHVHYRFAVRHIGSNGLPINYNLCDLDVDLETGRTFNVKWTPINQSEFVGILAVKPSYDPPMERIVD
jgi:hypothetical protein